MKTDNIKQLVKLVYTDYKKGNSIEIPDEYMNEYKTYFDTEYEKNGNSARSYAKRKFMRNKMLKSSYGVELKTKLVDLYDKQEYGIKSIAKQIGIGYTECRTLFDLLNIPIRKGRRVVTDRVCKYRSEKLKKEYKEKRGWFSSLERKTHKTQRGVQGYYFNKSRNKYVWLRSSWEFIYAKYLDKIGCDWDVECKTYTVNERTYRPDFFIFVDNKLDKIVEIKGFWDCREWKTTKLNELLSVEVIIIKDIKHYIPLNSSYGNELKEWKEKRKLKI